MAIGGPHPEPVEPTAQANERHPNRNRTNHDLDELLTVEDVAALLKVSKSWVYEHSRSRHMPRTERLPHIKVGKYVRFEGRAVRAFLDRHCRTT